MPFKRGSLAVLVVCVGLIRPAGLPADPVAVRNVEGSFHGFLALRTLDGTLLANGDLIQVARGARITSELAFHFKDGSLHDETTVFSESDRFRLVSDHVVQKGPTFSEPLDMMINAESGQVTVRYKNDGGKEKVEDERLELPADLANGMLIVLLKNVSATNLPPTVSYIAATPTPRLVKLALSATGADSLSIAGSSRRATHYVAKVEIGGLAGLLAPMLGKQPPDNHVWILGVHPRPSSNRKGHCILGAIVADRADEPGVAGRSAGRKTVTDSSARRSVRANPGRRATRVRARYRRTRRGRSAGRRVA